jgi:hypothetical protein
VFIADTRTGRAHSLPLAHGVDRLEALGKNAVVIGAGGDDLHFSGVRLSSADPTLAQHYVLKGASEGERRSQGFFYRQNERNPAEGILGLPVRMPAAPGYESLFEESTAVVFVRNRASQFDELGQLKAHDEGAQDDGCEASCVDWYGNSRPVFIDDRIFALMGYELVEGVIRDGVIHERRRVSFAPKTVTARR